MTEKYKHNYDHNHDQNQNPELFRERTETLFQDLQTTVLQFPDRPAVEILGIQTSYRQVYGQTTQMARAIVQELGGRPHAIAILGEKTLCSYVAMWTSLGLNVPFVPLNKKFPLERLVCMLEQSSADVIVADRSCLPLLTQILERVGHLRLVLLPESHRFEQLMKTSARIVDRSILSRSNGDHPSSEKFDVNSVNDAKDAKDSSDSSDSIAYILFTSGSTGIPKGVPITQRNLRAFLLANQRQFEICPTDRLSNTFDLTFDLAMFDTFMAWRQGACVCPMQAEDMLAPTEFVRSRELTVWFSVPSVIMLMARAADASAKEMPSLRLTLFCGEPLSVKLVQHWANLAPQSKLFNLYGPTELTIACSTFECTDRYLQEAKPEQIVPLGAVTPGHEYVILSPEDRIVSRGQVGELCVRGPQRFDGYLDSQKNRAAFVKISECGEDKFYRTGDLVSESKEFGLLYVGRKDRQVKLGGYRIELGEIEATLRSCPGVITAVAKVTTAGGQTLLSAFVYGHVRKTNLEQALKARLPTYMIPKHLEILEQLPVNTNGKVNHDSLRVSFGQEAVCF